MVTRCASLSIFAAAVLMNVMPLLSYRGASSKVMSSGLRSPKGSQISDGMNVKWSRVVEHDDLVALVQLLAEFQRGGESGEARADDDDALGGRREG